MDKALKETAIIVLLLMLLLFVLETIFDHQLEEPVSVEYAILNISTEDSSYDMVVLIGIKFVEDKYIQVQELKRD